MARDATSMHSTYQLIGRVYTFLSQQKLIQDTLLNYYVCDDIPALMACSACHSGAFSISFWMRFFCSLSFCILLITSCNALAEIFGCPGSIGEAVPLNSSPINSRVKISFRSRTNCSLGSFSASFNKYSYFSEILFSGSLPQ